MSVYVATSLVASPFAAYAQDASEDEKAAAETTEAGSAAEGGASAEAGAAAGPNLRVV